MDAGQWFSHHTLLLEKIVSSESREFWMLLAFGDNPAGESFVGGAEWGSSHSFSMFRIFSSWGIVHLLVLSGSQVGHLSNILSATFRMLFKSRHSWIVLLEKLFVFSVLFIYLMETNFPEPLLRAFLCFGMERLMPFASIVLRSSCAFALHVLFFSEQMTSLSFVLSWTAFLLLLLCGRSKLGKAGTLVLMSICCQFLVIGMKGLSFPSAWEWMRIVGGNLVMVGFFEVIVFPMVALSLVFSFAMTLAPEWMPVETMLLRFFDPISGLYFLLGEGLVGVLKTISYIVGNDS
jgi:hypothetical protein